MANKILKPQKTIALVAHDHKKDELVNWVKKHKDILTNPQLIATGTTGKLIEDYLGVTVQRVMSGPLGGDQQLGAMIATGDIDIVIFRYADVYLSLAEALVEKTGATAADFQEAIGYINKIRERAGLEDLTYANYN